MSALAVGVRLADVCEMIVDCEHKTAPTQESGIPSVRTPNIGRGRLLLEGVNRVAEDTYREWTRRAAPKAGDLILAREAPVGNVAIIPPGLQVCLGQRTVLLRPDRQLADPEYLVYLLLGPEMHGRLLSPTNGATVAHLNVEDIKRLALPPLPPLRLQRKIAAILSAYDDLIENNTRRIAILEEMAQALYREWFVNFRFPGHQDARVVESEIGPIPEGWKSQSYTQIIDVLSGGTPKTSVPEYWGGRIPWFTPRDLGDSFYVLTTAREITDLGLSKCNSQLYPAEAVFITARGTVGRCVLAGVPMAMSQTSYALRGHAGIPQAFVFLLTLSLVEGFRKQATGAVFDTIVVDTFRKQRIIVPSQEVLDAFARHVAPVFATIKNLQLRNANLGQTRDLLLPKLVSGEIDVSDLDIRVPEAVE